MLRRIFGPKRDEVTGEWRKLHNEELNDLYCLPNIVMVMKSRIMGWACSTYGENRVAYRVFLGRTKGKYHLEDSGVDGRIILKWIFKLLGIGCASTQ